MTKNTQFQIAIIKDEKAIDRLITSAEGYAQKYNERIHVAAVSAIAFAATHGRCDLLSRLFNGLRPAYQTALKIYISEHCGEVVETEGVDGKITKGWFGFFKFTSKDKRGTFSIVSGKGLAQRKSWQDSPQDYLAKPFYETKVEGVKPELNDESLAKALDSLIKKYTSDEANISNAAKATILEFRKAFDTAKSATAKAA